MKKLISLLLITTMLLSVMPTLVSASTTADPEGTVIMYNSTSSSTATGFTASKAIGAAGSTNTFLDSRMTTAGYNNTTPLAFNNDYNVAYATYTPNLTEAGLYEVYFWNVCVIDSTETFRNSTDVPPLSRNVTYTVTTEPKKDNGTYCISKHDFDPATASGGVNGWVSLGKFYFSGSADEKITVNKYSAVSDYLYLSAVKFVPVSAAVDPVGIERVYATKWGNASGTVSGANAANARNTVSDVKDGLVTFSDIGSANQVVLTVIPSDPNAKVSYNGGAQTAGYRSYTFSANAGKPFMDGTDKNGNAVTGQSVYKLNVTITSADGSTSETYPLVMEYENGTPILVKLTNSDKATNTNTKDAAKGKGAGADMYEYTYSDSTAKKVYVSKNLADTVTYSPNLTTAGYYNVYAYNTAPMKVGAAREALATVTHNGIREQTIIPFGGAVEGDWSPIGKFYFAGGADEKITLSNIVSSADVTNISDIKLVPAVENPTDTALRGISVAANGETHSVLEESADGYIMPLPAGTYTTAAVTVDAGSAVTDITINGTAATANTASNVAISDKDNYVTVAVTTASGTTEYKLNLYKQMKPYALGGETDATGDSTSVYYNVKNIGSTIGLPLDIDGAGNSLYKIAANATATPTWTPHIEEAFGTEAVAYHVLFWKPVLGSVNGGEDVYGSADLDITINAGGVNYYEKVDCTAGTSEWVDLGTYKINPANANLKVTLEKNIPEHLLVDQYGVIFLQTDMPTGISQAIFNGSTYYTEEQLNGKVLTSETSDGMKFVLWNATDKIYINGVEWASNVAKNVSYTPGMNRFEIVVKDADGNIADTCSFKVLSEAYTKEAESAVQTGTWTAVTDYSGVNGETVYANSAVGDSLAYAVSGNSKGDADVYVYRHLGTGTLTGTATVSIGDTTLSTVSNDASTSAGWVKVGSYNFAGGETITLTVTSGTILADAVKIVYTGTMYSTPVLVETETGYKAVADVYQTTSESVSATLYVAKYTNGGEFVTVTSAPLSLSGKGSAYSDTAVIGSGDGIYRAFIWNSQLKPLSGDADITVANEPADEPVDEPVVE